MDDVFEWVINGDWRKRVEPHYQFDRNDGDALRAHRGQQARSQLVPAFAFERAMGFIEQLK